MMDFFEVTVRGLPPAKSGRSMFGPGTSNHDRLLLLLEAAHREKSARSFSDFGSDRIALEVEVTAPTGSVPGDAPNYLGGIADALEIKKKREKASGSLEFLNYRRHVGLYQDDAQIKEITYREMEGDATSYVVKLRSLA